MSDQRINVYVGGLSLDRRRRKLRGAPTEETVKVFTCDQCGELLYESAMVEVGPDDCGATYTPHVIPRQVAEGYEKLIDALCGEGVKPE